MPEPDIRALQTLEALITRSAERYEAAANAAADPRLVTPLNDRAGERRRAAAALAQTAREIGRPPAPSEGLGGAIGRAAGSIRSAFAGQSDRATLDALATMEDELDRAFADALGETLAPHVRGEIDAISGSLRDAREELRRLIADHVA